MRSCSDLFRPTNGSRRRFRSFSALKGAVDFSLAVAATVLALRLFGVASLEGGYARWAAFALPAGVAAIVVVVRSAERPSSTFWTRPGITPWGIAGAWFGAWIAIGLVAMIVDAVIPGPAVLRGPYDPN